MNILKKTYREILNCVKVPPETGGILGKKHGIIRYFEFDKGLGNSETAIYIPDTQKLNNKIYEWENEGIEFCGIVHSHMQNQITLSSADKEYIDLILQSLSDFTNQLYFPIVIPGEQIISYKAIRKKDVVYIRKDKIKII